MQHSSFLSPNPLLGGLFLVGVFPKRVPLFWCSHSIYTSYVLVCNSRPRFKHILRALRARAALAAQEKGQDGQSPRGHVTFPFLLLTDLGKKVVDAHFSLGGKMLVMSLQQANAQAAHPLENT